MMKIRLFVIFFACLLAIALTPSKDFASGEANNELKMFIGQVEILPVNHPARIVIGNPDIIDVVTASREQVTINPKAAGKTTLVIWDNLGEQSFQVNVYAQNMIDFKERVDDLVASLDLPDVYTKADDEEGKVLLLGSVKTSEERERIITALSTLKDKIVDLMTVKELESVVEIDVQVLELDKDSTATLGFTWPASITLTDVSGPVSTAATGLKNVFYLSKFTRSAFNVTLDALVQEGKARILSRPRLACQSGKEAELLVGGEKPIFTTSVASTTGAQATQVEYKEFGIKLKIKPSVTDEDRIKLVLNVEVSEVGTVDTIGPSNAPTAKAFPLTKRTTSTELFLNNGQTMAISGLIKEKTSEDIRKTAFLGDIPILGAAFRKKTTQTGGGAGERGNNELFVMLTPTIISTKESAEKKNTKEEKISSQTEDMMQEALQKNASTQVFLPGALGHYSKVIQKRILDNLTYPKAAKESGFQGTVKLSLHLAYSGDLLDAGVKASSGYKILDDNVLAVARSIAKYPPFPPSVNKKDIWIDIPIDYRLD